MMMRSQYPMRIVVLSVALLIGGLALWLSVPAGLAQVRADDSAQIVSTTLPTQPALPAFPTETGIPIALSGVWGIAGGQPVAIRSGPSTTFARVGVLRAGRSIDITGTNGFSMARPCTIYFENDLDMWVEVRFGEQVGWMARCALTIRGDLSKLPVEAPPPANFAPPVPTVFPGAQG
ncbi:MAG: SH3 domain-containing protein [Chloroflexota bacterium]|nr:SH3 domain-containing protein [Chloroflexota bacterium]